VVFDVQEKQMTEDLTAEEIRALLKLEPHATCGFVHITFVSERLIAPGGCRRHSRKGVQPVLLSISW
jgi:predicted cupin superfamily sugar epimerase